MPYIDETDEEAITSEMRERKQITSSLIEICDNGKLLMLIPIPKEEYESYLAELESGGEKELRPGQWFLNDIQCLSEIRVPQEADPWA